MAIEKNKDTLCHCGDMPTAFQAALDHYITLAAAECPVYALGFATALKTIAIENLKKHGQDVRSIQGDSDQYTARTKELLDMDALSNNLEIKKQLLWN